MNDFKSVALPYCLKKLDDGTYVILNRKYKPVGFNTSNQLDYKDYPICHKIKGIKQKTAMTLSFNHDDNVDSIYLYSDSCIPTSSAKNMNKYLEKLRILSKYKITR
ncbi:MAG: hypothetical protein ABII88_09770 [Candidatus Omnitrophota bacterium]